MRPGRFEFRMVILLVLASPTVSAFAQPLQIPHAALRFGRPIIPTAAVVPQVDREGIPSPFAAPGPFVAEPAASRPGMTLDQLESIALANNPTILQAAMQVRAARGKMLQAGLYPNPMIGYIGEEMGAEGTAGQQGGFVGQEIVTAGKLGLRSAVVAHEVQQAEHAWQAQRHRVLNDVRTAWYETLAARQIVELNERLVGIGDEGVKAAEALLEALEVSRVDVLQARIEADRARLQLDDARNRHRAALQRLAAVIGVPETEPALLIGALEDDLPQLTWDGSRQRLLLESPELAEARAGVQRARCAVARECAERVPNLDVRAALLRHNVDRSTVATVEFGLPLNLFDRNQGNICKARAELIAAENEVQRVELVLQHRLAAAFARYENARQEVEKYAADILTNAKTSLELIQTGYLQGEFDYVKLLTAQRTYFQVNLAYLESLLELQASRVMIDGLLLSGGLERAPDGR